MEDSFELTKMQIDEIENEIAYWTEVLQKSEKYERLMQDADFRDALKDMEQTVSAHDNEIKSCLDGMSEYSPKLLQDAFHTIHVHQILKEQALKAMKRPEELLRLAKKARTRLPELQEHLSKAKEILSHV